MHRVFPMLATGLFLGVAWFDLGDAVNVPALFWADSAVTRIFIGFCVCLLFGYIWLLSGITHKKFEEKKADHSDEDAKNGGWSRSPGRWLVAAAGIIVAFVVPGPDTSSVAFAVSVIVLRGLLTASVLVVWLVAPEKWRDIFRFVIPETLWDWWTPVRDYLAVSWVPLCLLLAIPTIMDPKRLWLLVGIALGFAPVWAVALLIRRRRRTAVAAGKPLPAVGDGALRQLALVLFLALIVTFLILNVWSRVLVSPPVAPAVAVAAVLGLLTAFAAAIHYYCRKWTPVAGTVLLVLYIGCNRDPYKLRFPNLPADENHLMTLSDDDEPAISLLLGGGDQKNLADEEKQRVLRLCARIDKRLRPNSSVNWDARGKTMTPTQVLEAFDDLGKEIEKIEEARLNAWKQFVKEKTGRDKPKLVIVATTGGANRSALWTAVVLDELEREFRKQDPSGQGHFPKHVRLITGASGGMVGAAHFVSTLTESGHGADYQPLSVADDYLTPIINTAVFNEVPHFLSPLPYDRDRGRELDLAMERTTKALGQSFAACESDENAGWRPPLVFTPMIVDDGRRLIVSNLNLPFLTLSQGQLVIGDRPPPERTPPELSEQAARYFVPQSQTPAKNVRIPQRQSPVKDTSLYSRSAVELFRLFPDARATFSVSTAARMNASFPWLSPAVSLPTNPPRRIVDAGYYDNYGMNVAARWVHHWHDWLAKNVDGVVIIQIRDGLSENLRRRLYDPEGEPSWAARQLDVSTQWLTSPFSGAASSRNSVTSFRNDEQLEALNDLFKSRKTAAGSPFFTTAMFERPGDMAMNWYLTAQEKTDIVNAFNDTEEAKTNLTALDRLTKWWFGQPSIKHAEMKK